MQPGRVAAHAPAPLVGSDLRHSAKVPLQLRGGRLHISLAKLTVQVPSEVCPLVVWAGEPVPNPENAVTRRVSEESSWGRHLPDSSLRSVTCNHWSSEPAANHSHQLGTPAAGKPQLRVQNRQQGVGAGAPLAGSRTASIQDRQDAPKPLRPPEPPLPFRQTPNHACPFCPFCLVSALLLVSGLRLLSF